MKNLIFILLLLLSFDGVSQNYWKNRGNRLSHHGFVGLSAGNEYFISLPKFSYVARLDLLNKYGHLELNQFEFKRLFVYGGADVSMFVFFIGAFGASANLGVQAGYFTFEYSISTCHYYYDKHNNFTTVTYCPKAGIEIGPVWIKAGTSFNLIGDPMDFYKINNKQFNIEILINGIFNH